VSRWCLGPLRLTLRDFARLDMAQYRALMAGYDLRVREARALGIHNAHAIAVLANAKEQASVMRELLAEMDPAPDYEAEARAVGLKPPEGVE
jgi:hypothetical protein